MKKLLGTCLAAAAICACGFGSASAVNWQVFGQDSAGITWSIDQDSVQKSDKTATVMIKAQDSEGYHFIATEEFNHKKKTVKDQKVVLYNPQGYAEREDKGYSAAWLHHKGRNKHHMEYWIDYGVGDGRDGQKTHRGICGMKMPIKYVAEMYVDRVSASKNYQRDKFKLDSPLQYYLKGRKYYILNEDTKAMLELLLVMLAVKGEDEVNHFLKYEVLKGKVPYEKEYLINLRKNLEKGSAYHLEEEQ